ncbi:MAG: DUF4166 domain-containing protein [Hyphomonadaceae bacterium]|jgi:NAD(P)-dependent dehydrogenase (short-subunit alcohol dehydrogenase family)
MKPILILGGYGGFGRRLSRRLADKGYPLFIAGRSQAKAVAFCAELGCGTPLFANRDHPLDDILKAAQPVILIDAAGPFQTSDYRVAEACIRCGVHYLDLADGRDFVCGIGRLDKDAKLNGVVVRSGVSSVPALSGAVLRELVAPMTRVSRIDMAISASSRATLGASVAKAILSYAGQKLSLWRGQAWTNGFGWQELSRTTFEVAGRRPLSRLVALAEVPDHEIWPAILTGKPAVTFKAGTESAFQMLGLWLLSWMVRWKWFASLVGLGPILLPVQRLTSWLGNNRSAMKIEVLGFEGELPVRARWTLLAERGDGPEIPTMAAACLADLIQAGLVASGAQDSSQELALDQFQAQFSKLAISEEQTKVPDLPLYQKVMGRNFDDLPSSVRAVHSTEGDGVAVGNAQVARGDNPVNAFLCFMFGFPPSGQHDLRVHFCRDGASVLWVRHFGEHRMKSRLCQSDQKLVEQFGPLRFYFHLQPQDQGLAMILKRWTMLGLALPVVLAPRVDAREWDEAGQFQLSVSISLPLIGLIVAYRGQLAPVETSVHLKSTPLPTQF